MRFAVFLLALSAAGVLGGASLIGRWAVGLAVIAVSLGLAYWALFGEVAERPSSADVEASRERMRQRSRDAA